MVNFWFLIGAIITIGIGEVGVKWVLDRVSGPIESLSDPLSDNEKTKERWATLKRKRCTRCMDWAP